MVFLAEGLHVSVDQRSKCCFLQREVECDLWGHSSIPGQVVSPHISSDVGVSQNPCEADVFPHCLQALKGVLYGGKDSHMAPWVSVDNRLDGSFGVGQDGHPVLIRLRYHL